jgi:2-methylcitrate dehydratase PrpD
MADQQTLSQHLSAFAADLDGERIPAEVRQRAKMLLLDAIGVAFAATRFEFAQRALAGLRLMGSGESDVIGMPARLALRDAVLLNAVLVHGLDYDDTYLPGSVHLSASCVPTVLGVGAARAATGHDLLTALALGLEVGARLGAAGRGGFLRAGFHATSIVGTFACALAAGRLMDLAADQLTMAQGIALSTTSGNMQPMQDGSWTKRMHPGLSGASGILAATLAQQGYVGPTEAYEGRFGLFPCFLGAYAKDADLGLVRDGLGERWEFPRASIKLFPACHQSHAFFNAAIALAREHRVRVEDIESIRVRIGEHAVPLVCEPLASKRRPDSSYAAQFSLPYGIACCLTRGRFGLAELEPASYSNAALVALAHKVDYEVDADSGFPKFRSGEVIVNLKDGRKLGKRERILPDEPASDDAILEKFVDTATSVMSASRARRIRAAILDLEQLEDVGTLTRMLGV